MEVSTKIPEGEIPEDFLAKLAEIWQDKTRCSINLKVIIV